MTDVQEMFTASLTDLPLGVQGVAAAVDACVNCSQVCVLDVEADLAEQDVGELRVCISLCLNCADVCAVTARVLSRPAEWDQFVVERLLQACVRVCTSCADECARHADHHRHCAICEKACRDCALACAALLDPHALAEVRKPTDT